jgi:hypothetical protein
MKTRLMVPALLGLVLYGLLTYAASTIDLSGQWEMVLPDGRVYARLNLNQNGDRVSGTVRYDKGSAKVDGRISGSEAILSIIYDNADVLTVWYPRKVAEQAVGLTAIWKLALKPGATAYSLQRTFPRHGPRMEQLRAGDLSPRRQNTGRGTALSTHAKNSAPDRCRSGDRNRSSCPGYFDNSNSVAAEPSRNCGAQARPNLGGRSDRPVQPGAVGPDSSE